MVMASWPASPGTGRRVLSPGISRRLRLAQRRAMSAAVVVGGLAVALLGAADAAWIVARHGVEGRPMAIVELGVMLAAVGIAEAARRALTPPEALGLLLVASAFGATLVRIALVPDSALLPVAYGATIIVGSGSLLPWSRRWHAAWLTAALLMTLAFVALWPFDLAGVDRPQLIVAVAAAAAVSMVGQSIRQVRLERAMVLQIELRQVIRHARRQEMQVEELKAELVRTARIDTVTGIGNRRALDEALAAHAGRRLAVVLLDLDHFKEFNDRNGHLAGDAALARMGEVLRASVRENDLVFRYGGEEFLILMPGVQLAGAGRLAERVRRTVEADFKMGAGGLTISAGVAVADRFNSANPIPLLRRADGALYQAKRLGRNRVVLDGEAQAEQKLTVIN